MSAAPKFIYDLRARRKKYHKKDFQEQKTHYIKFNLITRCSCSTYWYGGRFSCWTFFRRFFTICLPLGLNRGNIIIVIHCFFDGFFTLNIQLKNRLEKWNAWNNLSTKSYRRFKILYTLISVQHSNGARLTLRVKKIQCTAMMKNASKRRQAKNAIRQSALRYSYNRCRAGKNP